MMPINFLQKIGVAPVLWLMKPRFIDDKGYYVLAGQEKGTAGETWEKRIGWLLVSVDKLIKAIKCSTI